MSANDNRPEASPRIGMIGCGYWGKNLLRNFGELDALEAVFDLDKDMAAKLAAPFSARVHHSMEELLADPVIDGVAIASPAALHYAHAMAALKAGKHVFVEKPLALDLSEAKELVEFSEARGLILMVGHLLQYHPGFLKLRELVDAGELGQVRQIYSNRLSLGKIRREENVLWSFAPHDISMILALMGEQPDSITAHGAPFLHKQIADTAMTQLGFPSGAVAHVFTSWLHPYKEQKLVVIGTDGMAEFNDTLPWDQKVQLYRHKIRFENGQAVPEKADAEPVPLAESEPLKLECQHYLNCISTGETPRTDGREGLAVLSVLHAADQALNGGEATAQDKTPEFDGVFIHESSYVDSPVEIGEGTKIWHFSHVLGNVKIGRNCVLGQNVVVGPKVSVGDNCKIQNNVSIYEGVTLADGVFCGPSCVFTNVNNPRAEIVRRDEFRSTPVGRGASIGANATIVCGHEIGDYAFIAAGAVVASDVPAFALMAGVPARRIGWMSHDGEKLGDDLVCPRSGRRYQQTDDNTLVEITPVDADAADKERAPV